MMMGLERSQSLVVLIYSLSITTRRMQMVHAQEVPPYFRYVAWSTLESTEISHAERLFYDEQGWNGPTLASVETLSWFSISEDPPATNSLETVGTPLWDGAAQNTALVSLGFDEEMWDCWCNHYGDYTWDELVLYEIDQYYAALGWDADSWNELTPAPTTDDSFWADLTEDQQTAALELCYFEDAWNIILPVNEWTIPDPDPTFAPSAAPSVPMTDPPTDRPTPAPMQQQTQPTPRTCSTDDECNETTEFCLFDDGSCGNSSGGDGTCTLKPNICSNDGTIPVCGCNGATYVNACQARMGGVSLLDETQSCATSAKTTCTSSLDCPSPDDYCYLPNGSCASDSSAAACCGTLNRAVVGTCQPKPTSCDEDAASDDTALSSSTSLSILFTDTLVCGCDGISYVSECDAALTGGVSIASRNGPCNNRPCGSFSTNNCPFGSFCWYPDGSCGSTKSSLGTCIPKQQQQERGSSRCSNVLDAVCGCDGMFYINACVALESGVSIQDPPGNCGVSVSVNTSTQDPTPPAPSSTMRRRPMNGVVSFVLVLAIGALSIGCGSS